MKMSEFLNALSNNEIFIAAGSRRVYIKVINLKEKIILVNSSGENIIVSFSNNCINFTPEEKI